MAKRATATRNRHVPVQKSPRFQPTTGMETSATTEQGPIGMSAETGKKETRDTSEEGEYTIEVVEVAVFIALVAIVVVMLTLSVVELVF